MTDDFDVALGRRLWLQLLPAEPQEEADDEQRVREGALHLAFQVLLGNSLLGRQPLSELMDQAARNGLFQNLEIGRPYRELARFRTQPIPPLADARHRPLAHPDRPNPRAGSPLLEPRSGPGLGYTVEKAHAILAERYELLPIPIRHTLPELLRDERLRDLFNDLRDEGWKDWHLLIVVMNLTVNHRIQARADHRRTLKRVSGRFLRGGVERRATGRPACLSTGDHPRSDEAENSDGGRPQPATLGPGAHHGDTYAAPVMQVLERRYGFWTDDVPHDDPFKGLLTTATRSLPGTNLNA